jgi:hypothetical protein
MLGRMTFRPIDSLLRMHPAGSAARAKAADSIRRARSMDTVGRRVLMGMRPSADSMPPFDGLLSAPGGILWVTENGVPGSDAGWSATAFASGGRLLGRVVGPGLGSPMAFSQDRVVVRVDDGKGDIRLVVYRFKAP